MHLPHFDVPKTYSPDSYLRELCEQGIMRRYHISARELENKPERAELKDRLAYELRVIQQTGFASYFLIVQDFVNWAKDHHITVLAAWPAVYWPRRDLAEPGLRKIRAFYESLGVPVLGDPLDTMPPLEQFFDTNNHLTAEAAKERTDALVRQLMPFLHVPSGAK